MRKSRQYHLAQLAVLKDITIDQEEKLAILNTLMGDESMALFSEEREAAKHESA